MLNGLTTRYPIAVDLSDGAHAVALQLAARRGMASIRACTRREVVEDQVAAMTDEAGVALLREALRDRAFKGRAVSLLPPPNTVLTYPLSVVPAKNESLEAAIVREAAAVLDVPVADAVIDYLSVQPNPTGERGAQRVLLVAVRRSNVQRFTQVVNQSGGVLESIELPASALLRAHGTGNRLGGKQDLLCCVGRSHTLAVVATRDGVVACRDIAWGTEVLRKKLTDNLEFANGTRDADFLLRKHGMGQMAADGGAGGRTPGDGNPDATVGQLLVPMVESLTHELQTVIGYVRSAVPDVQFGKGFLYGDGALVNGLDAYLAREIGMPVATVNPVERFALSGGHKLADPVFGCGSALALGLGLRRVRWL